MVHDGVNLLAYGPDLFNAVHIKIFHQLVGLWVVPCLLNESFDKWDHFFIFVINTKEQEVEQSHPVLLDVPAELAYLLDDLQIKRLLIFGIVHLLAQPVRLFEPVGNPVVEVHFVCKLIHEVSLLLFSLHGRHELAHVLVFRSRGSIHALEVVQSCKLLVFQCIWVIFQLIKELEVFDMVVILHFELFFRHHPVEGLPGKLDYLVEVAWIHFPQGSVQALLNIVIVFSANISNSVFFTQS